jgi:hypothetical protein
VILGAGVALRLNGRQKWRLSCRVELGDRPSHEHRGRRGVLVQMLPVVRLLDGLGGGQLGVT